MGFISWGYPFSWFVMCREPSLSTWKSTPFRNTRQCSQDHLVSIKQLGTLLWTYTLILYVQTQSADPVRFLIFCSISIILLASLVTVGDSSVLLVQSSRECTAGAEEQGMYSIRSIHWNIKSAPASPGRSRVGLALYTFSLLVYIYALYCTGCIVEGVIVMHK